MKPLKYGQIQAILALNSYVIFQDREGKKTPVNCRIAKTTKIGYLFHCIDANKESSFVSYSECSLNEYINQKPQ